LKWNWVIKAYLEVRVDDDDDDDDDDDFGSVLPKGKGKVVPVLN
jgi:hypothetical protein